MRAKSRGSSRLAAATIAVAAAVATFTWLARGALPFSFMQSDLSLRGGARLVFRVHAEEATSGAQLAVAETLRRRAVAAGVAAAAHVDGQRVVLELPGVEDEKAQWLTGLME